jgi:glycosyltransferase involved in cell wall biosynthesis
MRLAINVRPLVTGKIGGMETYVRNIVARLAQRRDIEELCLLTSAQSHGVLDASTPRVREILIADGDPGTQISRELRRRKSDILFCPLIDLEPRTPALPSLVTIPDLQHERYPELFDAQALAWRRSAYPASVSWADVVFTISKYSRDSICGTYAADPAKVVDVPLDVDDVFRGPVDHATDQSVREQYRLPSRYVFYPAITWRHKNHPTLLEALQRFNASGQPPMSLVLCGGQGSGHAEVTAAIARLRLGDRVMMLGRVPAEHLPSIYRGAFALVLPSLFEGFGLPILEAFRAGCPVVCSDRTSCPEVAGDAAEYVDPTDAADVAAALVRLAERPGRRDELMKMGHRRAGLFSWAEAERRTFEAMRGLLERGRRAIEVESWPSFTVVTPSLNQAQFIGGTIESVLGQKYPHLDYIVVDGGSTDGTLDLLRRYEGRIRWLSEPDRGQGDAVNKGVRLGRGELLGWLNSDDTYWPGALERAALAFRRRDRAAVVYGDANHVLDDGSLYGPYPTSSFDYARLSERCFICQPAAFIRRQAFDEVGALDTSLGYCMDYDLWIRLGRDHCLVYLPEILANSRLHKDAKTLARRRQVYREILRTVARHYGYIPYPWIHGYTSYLLRRSTDEVFEAHSSTIPALVTTLALGVWRNRRHPRFASRFLADAGRRVGRRLGVLRVTFEGRWADGWISRRYVTTVDVNPGTDRLVIRGRHHMPAAPPIRMGVFLNNRLAAEQVLQHAGPFEVKVPTPHSRGGTMLVTITADRSFRPLWHGMRDARLLSCVIDEVGEA